jgi:hypothetical protein
MATYKEIQEWVKKQNELTVKTCWIAHAKELSGIELRRAPNRRDPSKRLHPCPDAKLPAIKAALEHFGMI